MSEAGIQDTSETPGTPEAPATEPSGPRSFLQRVIGAVRLDTGVYAEVARDRAATGQAVTVVLAAAAAVSILNVTETGSAGLVSGLIQIGGPWIVTSLLVWAIGNFFGHQCGVQASFNVIGFAMAPFVLALGAVVPLEWLQVVFRFVSVALVLAAFVTAVRALLSVPAGRAVFVCFVVVLVEIFVAFALQALLAQPTV